MTEGQLNLTGSWEPHGDLCAAQPCPVCAACSVCMDFHSYTGRGCTTENCPIADEGDE